MGKRVHRNIAVRGTVYPDANAAANALGVTAGQVCRAARRGRLDSLGLRSGEGSTRVTIRGVAYESFAAAARDLGVHVSTVRTAHRRGTLHRVGTGRVGPEPMRVRIAGQVFENVHDAAAHFGCCAQTIWAALADGDPDRIARPQRYNPWKAQPFKVGGLAFPSMRAASRALGFSDEYIASVMKRGSQKGRERILAAALQYAAEKGVSAT